MCCCTGCSDLFLPVFTCVHHALTKPWRPQINEGEDGLMCAARETEEETGWLPPAGVLSEERKVCIGKVTLYVGVAPLHESEYSFSPKVRKEIHSVKWHLLSKLKKHPT